MPGKSFEEFIYEREQRGDNPLPSATSLDYYTAITVEELYKEEYSPERYIIDKFLPQTGFTMFSGDSGVGKSWVALEIIRAITNNDIFLDHFEIKTPNLPILLIDKENGLRRLQARMKSIGVPATDSVYLLKYSEKFSLEDTGFIQSVKELIEEKEIGIVILDSFVDVMIGDESSSADTAKVFNLLRSISKEICWVLLHHESRGVPKVLRTGGERYRGSTNIKAQLDYLFSIQATKSSKVIHIEQGKARDYEMMVKFAMEFVALEGTGEMAGFKYVGEVKDEDTKLEEAIVYIEEYLTDNPSSFRRTIIDSAEGLHTQISLDRALKVLRDRKVVVSDKAGKQVFYSLNTPQNDQI